MEMDEWKMEKVKMVEAGVSGSTAEKIYIWAARHSVNPPRAWQNVPS